MHTIEGSKRQLPAWMLQKVVAASHVNNSDNVVETSCCYKEKGDIRADAGNVTKKKVGIDHKRGTSRRKSNSNPKCDVKRKRNMSQEEGSDDNTPRMKKKKGNRPRDRVKKSSTKKGKVLEESSDDDDDVELTMEDLMTIAKQYVKDYESKEQQETSGRQCESKWQFPAKSESRTAVDSPCEKRNSYSSVSETQEVSTSTTTTTTGDLISTNASLTVHPAQEMLDLFLGPLLRKPLEK